MNEYFLHYIWQYQYFDKSDLMTTSGEPVSIFIPGIRNNHSGPDFSNAKVRIGKMDWVGNVEIHIDSSGWIAHHHDVDSAYENVILHVVWKEDKKIKRRDQSELPTIELKSRVDHALFTQYKKLINNPEKIPCSAVFHSVKDITKMSMLDRALMQRLETKSIQLQQILARNNNDWEETAYQLISRNFGFKVNADPFFQLAQSLPYKIIMKHADQLLQVEALLFGQAGFLEEKDDDDYTKLLKREYHLLSTKYNLRDAQLSKAQWRFLRLRPANFPSLRIAQLAALLSSQKNLFSRIIEARSYRDFLNIFSVTQSDYWKNHYQFLKPMKEPVPSIGTMSIDNIIINTAVPLMVAFGKAKDDQLFVDRGIEILTQTTSENNIIVKGWKELGLLSKSAADSQGMIELHNNYCVRRRCLDCNIGFSLLKPAM